MCFYRHVGPKGPKEASIGKNARSAGDNLGNLGNLGNPALDNWHRGGQAPALR